MKIKFKHFTLQPGLYARDRWDVLKTSPVIMNNTPVMRKKHGDIPVGTIVGTKEEELGYDMILENAIQKTISYLLAEDESTTDLNGFLDAYKKQKSELENLLKL